jgi:hypothetical protein
MENSGNGRYILSEHVRSNGIVIVEKRTRKILILTEKFFTEKHTKKEAFNFFTFKFFGTENLIMSYQARLNGTFKVEQGSFNIFSRKMKNLEDKEIFMEKILKGKNIRIAFEEENMIYSIGNGSNEKRLKLPIPGSRLSNASLSPGKSYLVLNSQIGHFSIFKIIEESSTLKEMLNSNELTSYFSTDYFSGNVTWLDDKSFAFVRHTSKSRQFIFSLVIISFT